MKIVYGYATACSVLLAVSSAMTKETESSQRYPARDTVAFQQWRGGSKTSVEKLNKFKIETGEFGTASSSNKWFFENWIVPSTQGLKAASRRYFVLSKQNQEQDGTILSDILSVPNVKDTKLAFSGCFVTKTNEPAAAFLFTRNAKPGSILLAWSADTVKGILQPVKPREVTCESNEDIAE